MLFVVPTENVFINTVILLGRKGDQRGKFMMKVPSYASSAWILFSSSSKST